MKDLFMCLLLNLNTHGDITEADMYKGGELSTIRLKTKNSGSYVISISKVKEKDGNDND